MSEAVSLERKSTERKAQERIVHARKLPGFHDEPDCFLIDRYTLDLDMWIEGFVTVPRNERTDRCLDQRARAAADPRTPTRSPRVRPSAGLAALAVGCR